MVRWREDGEEALFNLRSTRGYSQAEKERIRELTDAHEVLLIFEKRLG